MLALIIMMVFGGTTMKAIDYQTAYCNCKRDNFSGKQCESFKPSASDSCRK